MTNPIEALERLTKLRDDGVLSASEFEAEKARYFPAAQATGETNDGNKPLVYKLAALGVVLGGGVLAVSLAINGALPFQKGSFGTEGAFSSSDWTISSTRDPMNDLTMETATTTVSGNWFNLEFTVACNGGQELSYTMSTYDKSGQPAEMRYRQNYPASYIVNSYSVRRDDLPTDDRVEPSPYTNQARLSQQIRRDNKWIYPEDYATASRLAVRLYLSAGEETYEIAQTDPKLRTILDRCVNSIRALREKADIAAQAELDAARERDRTFWDRRK